MSKRMLSLCLALLVISPVLSGCMDKSNSDLEIEDSHWLPAVEERFDMQYRTDDVFSRVSSNGSYDIGPVKSVFVPDPVSYTHLTLPTKA